MALIMFRTFFQTGVQVCVFSGENCSIVVLKHIVALTVLKVSAGSGLFCLLYSKLTIRIILAVYLTVIAHVHKGMCFPRLHTLLQIF